MPRTLDAPAHGRLLAAGVAAVVAAGAVALSADEPRAPAQPAPAPEPPYLFGDPPVAKGAHGVKKLTAPAPLFRDPWIRKGAGGG
jgi:hypothetical protein